MAMPDDMTVQQVVDDIRPGSPNEYAIETIKKGWVDFRSKIKPHEGDLTTALEALAEDWKGDDYDAFEEQVGRSSSRIFSRSSRTSAKTKPVSPRRAC